MNCHCCNGETKKSGRFQNHNRIVQRYQCKRCGKTFSENQPLDGMRVDFKQACNVVHLLCESMGIRAIQRFTGLHQETILNILETAGRKAANFLDLNIKNVKSDYCQADEVHSTVYCKQANADPDNFEIGEQYTYLAVDRETKLIISHLVGKRTRMNTNDFMADLASRLTGRTQLTTDGLSLYSCLDGAVERAFGDNVDYATEIKYFSKREDYSQAILVGISRMVKLGDPDLDMTSNAHIERTNLSVRTFTRRFTRCTLGYSKKLENHKHAVALFIWHFNYCRKHSAHKQTPAMAAGLTDRVWTIADLLQGE